MTPRICLPPALAMALALSAFPLGTALAQTVASCPPGVKCSQNTIVRGIPLNNFKENDIGLIVDLVYDICNNSDVTVMPNGPYRRVSNAPGPTRDKGQDVISEGDARHDLVVWDSKDSPGGLSSGMAMVDSAGIDAQVGMSPGITLSATFSSTSIPNGAGKLLTVTDTTGAGADYSPQLVDAGLFGGVRVGGLDAIVSIKNGTPKTADLICDVNMWYSTDGTNIQYGVYQLETDVTNRLLLMWAMGPSGAGTSAAITSMCNAWNAGGAVPIRDYDQTPPVFTNRPGSVPAGVDPVSSYASGRAYLREVETVAVPGRAIRVAGDPELPANETACRGIATYCDVTEPTPQNGFSGNSCTKRPGFPSAFAPYFDIVNVGNASRLVCIGGICMVQSF